MSTQGRQGDFITGGKRNLSARFSSTNDEVKHPVPDQGFIHKKTPEKRQKPRKIAMYVIDGIVCNDLNSRTLRLCTIANPSSFFAEGAYCE
ncbi:MAG: hypothetical protein OQK23_09130 [Rhodospirillales bacterium]|nr:hypothetical protein [Rhodospirillales bacterium]